MKNCVFISVILLVRCAESEPI